MADRTTGVTTIVCLLITTQRVVQHRAAITAPQHWLGEGDPAGFDLREGGRMVFQAPGDDNYPMHIEKIEPKRYLACRWAIRFPPQQPREGNATLVEFTLIPKGAKTRLRVVERGFAALAVPEDERRHAAEDNTGAWEGVLDHLRRSTEQPQG
ncbi:MAG TPA: SRPBCC domain-containing protein [Actinomycetes bacterium]|nr:SRPBCC domain-containing protein [Actinomycetes bacterium]